MARSILDQAHALQIQSMGDLGRIRDLDRTLAGTLMAEFSRVQLIVQEDVGKSLVALRSDLLAACSAFLADVGRVMDVTHADPRLALLEASLERFRRQASLKFDLPLAEMDAAVVDITTFMNACLQELSSLSKLPDLIGEAATLMDQHHNRVWELVQNPDLGPRRAAGPATNRGRPVPRHPGRISWESWSVSGGNGQPTPPQTGRRDEAMGHRSQTGRI